MPQEDSLILGSKKYISSKRAAKTSKYTPDYIGQLSREEKIKAQKIGNIWYVEEDSLQEYIKTVKPNKATEFENSEEKEQIRVSENPLPVTPAIKPKKQNFPASSFSIGKELTINALSMLLVAGFLVGGSLATADGTRSARILNEKGKTLALASDNIRTRMSDGVGDFKTLSVGKPKINFSQKYLSYQGFIKTSLSSYVDLVSTSGEKVFLVADSYLQSFDNFSKTYVAGVQGAGGVLGSGSDAYVDTVHLALEAPVSMMTNPPLGLERLADGFVRGVDKSLSVYTSAINNVGRSAESAGDSYVRKTVDVLDTAEKFGANFSAVQIGGSPTSPDKVAVDVKHQVSDATAFGPDKVSEDKVSKISLLATASQVAQANVISSLWQRILRGAQTISLAVLNWFGVDTSNYLVANDKDTVQRPLSSDSTREVSPPDDGIIVEIKEELLAEDQIDRLRNSFSDDIEITEVDDRSGVITPVFKEGVGDEYVYVLVPVKESR